MKGRTAGAYRRECRAEHEDVDQAGPQAIPGRSERQAAGEHPVIANPTQLTCPGRLRPVKKLIGEPRLIRDTQAT